MSFSCDLSKPIREEGSHLGLFLASFAIREAESLIIILGIIILRALKGHPVGGGSLSKFYSPLYYVFRIPDGICFQREVGVHKGSALF